MGITLAKIGTQKTIAYAFQELVRCLKEMDETLFVEERTYDSYEEGLEDVLWIGLDGSVPPSKEDTICIQILEGAGIITGSNERSVLLAVYRALYELGCRWIRPGKSGELIPRQAVTRELLQIQVEETASYGHRAICIEGANDYSHVYDMIDWIPKLGMNGYFVQFEIPYHFFNNWYSHESNPTLSGKTLSREDVRHIWKRLEEEVLKRGLSYHAVGHGWTCEPFGVKGGGWHTHDGEIGPEVKQYFAQVDGMRELWKGVPLDTNLCYSNPKVRGIMTDAMVDYLKKNPQVDYLHFWLADAYNNQCECPECQKMRPADFYVMALNELDEKLTRAGISTKVVFLIYVDLLWEPEHYRILNPDRFVLMFAPITRTYTKALVDRDESGEISLLPYERNKLVMPKSVEENIARLSRWQSQFAGDSFDFDYHMMWDHIKDPGYYECARILHRDMVNLDQIGLNGMVSCQVQRACFPTGLPMYAMARGLWDKQSDFQEIAREYFQAAFEEDGKAAETYFSTLSRLFHPPYIRRELPEESKELALDYEEVINVVKRFQKEYIDPNQNKNDAWKYLSYHAKWCMLLAEMLRLRTMGEKEASVQKAEEWKQYANEIEMEVHEVLDVRNCFRVFRDFLTME